MNEIEIIKQTSESNCGQACIAMITGKRIEEISLLIGKKSYTSTREVANVLNKLGYKVETRLIRISKKNPLPPLAIVKLKILDSMGGWESNWHWTVFNNGIFLDPDFGKVKEYSLSKHGMKPSSFIKIEKP